MPDHEPEAFDADRLRLHGVPDLTESLALVARSRAGEREALEGLLERYADRVRRIVRIRLGGRSGPRIEALDIVRWADLLAAPHLERVQVQDHAGIIRVLSQIVLDQVRDARAAGAPAGREVDPRRTVDLDRRCAGPRTTGPRGRAGGGPQLDETAWRRELQDVLDESMTELSRDYQEVILQRDYCGAEWSDVVERLGLSTVPAVQELHRRAWVKLRRLVRPRISGLI